MTSIDFDTAVDQALLINYDWDPACELRGCPSGYPPAAYVIFHLRRPPCDCFPSIQLICSDCAEAAVNLPDVLAWRCKYCRAPVNGRKAELWRIEPLS